MENARLYKMVKLSFSAYVSEQIRQMHPFTFPVWLAGLCLLIFSRAYRRFQALGWCYLAVLVLFVVEGGKSYYLAPAYAMLFAFGAIWFEKWVSRIAIRVGLLALLIVGGCVTLPLALPVLPVEAHIRYAAVLGQTPNAGGERHEVGKQILRAGTSAAADYAEVRADESRNDFIHKLGIVRKELCECLVWLRLIARKHLVPAEVLEPIRDECDQLVRIVSASKITAEKNARLAKQEEN